MRGYLGEQFEVLKHRYPHIQFLENPLFNEANNISSAWVARGLLQSAYVCEADLLLKNPLLIRKYEYVSNYQMCIRDRLLPLRPIGKASRRFRTAVRQRQIGLDIVNRRSVHQIRARHQQNRPLLRRKGNFLQPHTGQSDGIGPERRPGSKHQMCIRDRGWTREKRVRSGHLPCRFPLSRCGSCFLYKR